ncbi:MAG: TIGR02266 family protein [Deltaproteobacteria bacterium]|nr:MAG: TIGR02266 family protein [Deltaproteobacteria bacterium]
MSEEQNDKPVQVDKRCNLRAPILVRKVRVEENRRVFFGYAKNLSRGGLFLATVNPLEPGSRVTVELTLPPLGSQTLTCDCEVVWKRHYQASSPHEPGMGLRFVNLAEETAVVIDTWVRQQDMTS